MQPDEVIDLYNQLESIGVTIWIDGGWNVDALLGKQTRLHKDLDIAIEWNDVPRLREFLVEKGYKQIREDNKWNFVLADSGGREIDVHAFVSDNQGNIRDGIMYPPQSLKGTGQIHGQTVRCITPEYVVKFHSGYELTEKDFQDISAICKKFAIELPKEYLKFK